MRTDWYILRVRPKHESQAVEFLEEHVKGARVYYPIARRQRIEKHALATREESAFPGYVFASFQGEWPNLEHLREYCAAAPTLIIRAGEPLTFRESQIEELRQFTDKGGFDQLYTNPLEQLVRGRMVRIPSGALYGYTGKIRSVTPDIVKISVKLLGKPVFMSLPTEDALANLC